MKMPRTILVISVVMLPLTSALFTTVRAADGNRQTVNVMFVDCSQTDRNYSAPLVNVGDLNGKLVFTKVFPRQAPTPIRNIDFLIAPGNYTVGVSNGDCGESLDLAVLSGHDRSVVAFSRSRAMLTANNGVISGELPSTGWRVAIVLRDRAARLGQSSPDGFLQITAAVENDAYYAVGLPRGEATIRLYNQRMYRWIDFDGGMIGADSKGWIRRDISVRELNGALNTIHGL